MEVLRRSRFRGNREREPQRARPPECRGSRRVVAEHVAEQEGGRRCDHTGSAALGGGWFRERRTERPTAARERGVGTGEVEQVDLCGAEGHRQAVARRRIVEHDAGPVEHGDKIFRLAIVEELHRGDVDGTGERGAKRDDAAVLLVIVLRVEAVAVVGAVEGSVVDEVARREAIVEGHAVHERFDRRTGLALLQRPVDHAAVSPVEVVAAPLPGPHRAGAVVEHDDGDVGRAALAQQFTVMTGNAGDVFLQRRIESGAHGSRFRGDGDVCGKHGREVRGNGVVDPIGEVQRLGLGHALLGHGDGARSSQATQDPTLPGTCRVHIGARVERRRPLGDCGKEGGFAPRELGDGLREIDLRGRVSTDDPTAVGRLRQVVGKDCVLREPVLEAQRVHRLLQLAGERIAPPTESEFHQLLTDGRAALGDSPSLQVGDRGPAERDRVDAQVRSEALVLGGERGRRQAVGPLGQRRAARRGLADSPRSRARRLARCLAHLQGTCCGRIEGQTVAVGERGELRRGGVQHSVGQRPEANPCGQSAEGDGARTAADQQTSAPPMWPMWPLWPLSPI